MRKRKILRIKAFILLTVLITIGILMLYRFNYIPHKKYTNKDFHIPSYSSQYDMDNDGVDDQTDILLSAYKYLATEPKYKSKYYECGYPDDEYGVCTDVVAQALLGAGYDLQQLVNADILSCPYEYNIDEADINIDFRRVVNLNVFLKRNALSLTTDIYDIEEWQGGDIVVFPHHIGIISDHRNKNGLTFVLHHGSPYQASYEQDILDNYDTIVGHYRIS